MGESRMSQKVDSLRRGEGKEETRTEGKGRRLKRLKMGVE